MLARRVPAEGRARALIDGQAAPREARRGARAGAGALLGPARAPPAGEPRQPARGARRVRGAGTRWRAPSAWRSLRRRLGGLDRALRRPGPGARPPSASGPTWRSWWRRSTRPASSVDGGGAPCAPSASGCATPKGSRRRPRRRPRRCRRSDGEGGARRRRGRGGAAPWSRWSPSTPRSTRPTPSWWRPQASLQEAVVALRGLPGGSRRRARAARPGGGAPRGLRAAWAAGYGPGAEAVLARAAEAREALRGLDEGAGDAAGARRGALGGARGGVGAGRRAAGGAGRGRATPGRGGPG